MFITPVSIKVTKDKRQFIIDELRKLKYSSLSLEGATIIGTNLAGNDNKFSDFLEGSRYEFENYRYYCEDNVDLFLALAAMTDDENGIAGEYWKCISKTYHSFGDKNSPSFVEGKIYKQIKELINDPFALLNEQKTESGWSGENKNKRFKKATKEEIINHFNKNKALEQGVKFENNMIGKEIIGYKVKDGLSYIGVMTILNHGVVPENANNWNARKVNKGYNIDANSVYAGDAKKLGVLDSLFEPVYKDIEKVLAIRYDGGSFPVEITKDHIEVINQGKIGIRDVENLVHFAKNFSNKINNWKIEFKKVDIGCHKGIHIEDIEKAYEIYKSLQ